MMTAFQLAELYEVLGNRSGRLEREGPLLLEALAAAPNRRLADLACGLGLHAAFFAEHGAQVYASDLSAEMVAHAQKHRSAPTIQYRVGDMCFPSDGPFGLMVCLGNSLCLLANKEKLATFFRNSFEVLSPGGILITQTLNYEKKALQQPRIRTEEAKLPQGKLVAVKRFVPEATQTQLTIDYLSASSTGMRETRESFVLQHWSASFLQSIGEKAGFSLRGRYGGYDKSPLSPDSTDIILSFEKPSSKQ